MEAEQGRQGRGPGEPGRWRARTDGERVWEREAKGERQRSGIDFRGGMGYSFSKENEWSVVLWRESRRSFWWKGIGR